MKNLQLNYPNLKIGIYHSSLSRKVRDNTEKQINCVLTAIDMIF